MTKDLDRNREENVLWTVSGKYEELANDRLVTAEDRIYGPSLEGIVRKNLDSQAIFRFYHSQVDRLSNRKDLRKVGELYLDHLFKDDLDQERKGSSSRRKAYIKDQLARYKRKGKKTFIDEISHAYYSQEMRGMAMTTPIYQGLLKEILGGKKGTTTEVIQDLNRIFTLYFHSEESFLQEEDKKTPPSKTSRSERPSRTKSLTIFKETDTDDLEKYAIESAEFTTKLLMEGLEDKERAPHLEKEALGPDPKMEKKVIQHYGRSSLSLSRQKTLEKKICTGIHKGIHLHYTKAKYEEDQLSQYYRQMADFQKEENLKEFEEKRPIYRRNIAQMKAMLKKTLLDDQEDDIRLSSAGNLKPALLWKQEVLGQDKIFERVNRSDVGLLQVDLLLDSSGSQEDQQEKVGIQAYILAQALTELHVPTRVLGYHNIFNYLVIEEYRDYRDEESKNKNIFRYHATGSNRDGLALAYTYETMNKTSEGDHILIVLSDGKPNDKINLGLSIDAGLSGENYEDEEAIEDTAKKVLNLRLQDIHVLGVYTGKEEDLDNEVRIYGKDFAYIQDLTRFSVVVGKFLKSIIHKMR